ncbi:glycosyltransferase family 4 protein [bacterium]|nr:glycosyltransferase family 4 protein [bacterium]
MKCLMLHQCSLDNIGGVETYYNRLIKSFKELGVITDFKVITPDIGDNRFCLLFKPLFFQKKIRFELNQLNERYDFIITRHPYFTIAAKEVFPNIPVIFIPPGNIHKTIQYNYKYGNYSLKEKLFSFFWSGFLGFAQRKALHYSDFINYFSKSSMNWIDPSGYTRFKSIINPPGGPEISSTISEKIVNQILFIGRLVPCKNSIMILDIAEKNPDYYFVIAGDGIEKDNLLRRKEKKFLDNVIFVEGSQADKYLTNSSILVIPSFRESFGHVIVEAFCNGMPVLGLRPDGKNIINANVELIPDKFGGLFNDASEVHDLLLKFSKLSLKERMQIREYSINRFNMKAHSRRLFDIIKNIKN